MGWQDAPQESASPAWASAPAAQEPTARPAGTPEQNRQKFLNFLGTAEAADYDVIVGGKRFTDFSRHPNVTGLVTGDGPSTAAGKYQITGTTYRDVAPKLGVTDFSKKSQDSIALELIRRKGALADVDSGNWEGAISKLGGTWASLPSSPYNQPKKSMAWSLAVLNGQTPPSGGTETPSGYASAPASGYKPFAQVRQNIDPKSLNADQDWLKASALLYELWERKTPEGKTPNDLAEWGKDRLGYFNFNTVDMARIARAVTQGSQEQKEAFLFMLDTYDNTNMSWEGAGRAAKGVFTDPLNLVGLGTFGIGFGAKMAARTATKEAAKAVVKRSMLEATKDAIVTGAARTGIVAGMEGALYGGVQSGIKQEVEVSAGRRNEISLGKVAGDAALGAAAGLTLGTGLDVVTSKAISPAARALAEKLKGKGKEAPQPKVEPTMGDPVSPEASPAESAAGMSPEVPPRESSAAPGRQQDGRLPADEVAPQSVSYEKVYRGVKVEGQESSKGVTWATPDEGYAKQYGDKVSEMEIPSTAKTLDLTEFNSVSKLEDVYGKLVDLLGSEKADKIVSQAKENAAGEIDVYKIFRNEDAIKILKAEGFDVVKFKQIADNAEATTVGILNKDILNKPKGIAVPDMKFGDTKKFVLKDGTKITVEKVIDEAAGTSHPPGYTPKETDFGALLIARNEDGEQIGFLAYLPGSTDIQAEVNSAFQRKGIGTLLYDIAEKQGADFSEDPRSLGLVSEDAIKLREARNARGDGDVMGGARLSQNDGSTLTVPDVPNTGMRTTRVNGEEVAKVTTADVEEAAAPLVQQLKDLPPDQIPQALEQLRTGAYPREQQRVVDSALRLFNRDLKKEATEAIIERDKLLGKPNRTPEEEIKLQELTATVEEKLDRLATPGLADDAAGSMGGTMLNDRRNGGAGNVKITVEDIMAEKGLGREEALTVWAEVIAKAEQDSAVQKVAGEYEVKIQAALEAGDSETAVRLAVQKKREIAGMVEQVAPGSASFLEKAKELAISDVFSPTTPQINLIPSAIQTFITPGLKYVFGNPLEKAARAEVVASYSAMRSSFMEALKGAAVSARLEQSLLTGGANKYTEGPLAIKGLKGSLIRTIPRILNASDELLSRLNNDIFVAGKAAAEATMEGVEKGLKGKSLDDFVKAAKDKALKESRSAENGDDLVQPVINKGINLGLKGDELWDWVEKEAMRNPDALRKATSEEAVGYINDVLYKRDFSGEGGLSKAAIAYEKMSKAMPGWALVTGQLFFRTVVRVFETGIRLTPGLQLIAPRFLADLAGKNGTARQVRAQAESMTSLAVAGAVMSLYAQGRITGDGAYSDFKQKRNRADGPEAPQYSIKMSDGSWWSYKLFDPISTPMKIMINALERADKLRLKQSQGEDIPDSMIEDAYQHVSVGVAAVLVAIKDANLVSGLKVTGELLVNAEDIEKNEDRFLKFLGEKMSLLVPNTLHKIAKDNDPTIKDPADFWQMVDEKLARPLGLDGKLTKTSKSYDILGNPRRPADTGALWNIFSTASQEELAKGMTMEQQEVLKETDRLTRVMGATFKTPIKHASLGDLDLRTVMAKDGKRTLYDVWQDNYRELKPEIPMYEIAKSDVPSGTYAEKGKKAEALQSIQKQFQEAAFAKLRMDEGEVINQQIEDVLRNRALSKSGMFDSKTPY